MVSDVIFYSLIQALSRALSDFIQSRRVSIDQVRVENHTKQVEAITGARDIGN